MQRQKEAEEYIYYIIYVYMYIFMISKYIYIKYWLCLEQRKNLEFSNWRPRTAEYLLVCHSSTCGP